MGRTCQPKQRELFSPTSPRGNAHERAGRGKRSTTASGHEHPANPERLMEEICEPANLKRALRRVMRNKGSPGVDGMTVEKLPIYVWKHWESLRSNLLRGRYQPCPVKRVEIPKPSGGMRKLGIPCVLDRFVQQAVLQVLQRQWDPTFSDCSYGFRPNRSAHQAVARAQQYIVEGYEYVVDLDLEKFFDRVNHDMLMGKVAKRVKDKRVLKLIRGFLNAGVLEGGLISPTVEGTPQGGPLSPLLSNLFLDDLDAELSRRGLRFVRYADDCNVYVRSERAGRRVMENIKRFLTTKLKLKVNTGKSAVDTPQRRSFLGFSFTKGPTIRRRVSDASIARLRDKVRELTRRCGGRSLTMIVRQLRSYLKGWLSYYDFAEAGWNMQRVEFWLRHRLRCVIWTHWTTPKKRYAELRKRKVRRVLAARAASSSKGAWRLSAGLAVQVALSNVYFSKLGIPPLTARGNA